MKKMFEFATRGKEALDFNSEKFIEIKEMVERELRKKMGKDMYEEFSYQCNCTQMLDEENVNNEELANETSSTDETNASDDVTENTENQ